MTAFQALSVDGCSKITNILESSAGVSIKCKCPYCDGKAPDELVVDEVTKKHLGVVPFGFWPENIV